MLIFSPLSIFFCIKAWTMLFKVHLYTCSKHGCHYFYHNYNSSPVFSSLLLDIPLRHFFTFSKRIILLYWRKKGNRTKKLILHCETLWTYMIGRKSMKSVETRNSASATPIRYNVINIGWVQGLWFWDSKAWGCSIPSIIIARVLLRAYNWFRIVLSIKQARL